MFSRLTAEERENLMRDAWDSPSDTYISESEIDDEYERLARKLGLSGHSDGKRSRRKKYVRICLYAALWIGALCIAGTGVAMISASEEASGEIAGIKFIEHYTAYGEREEFILPDSSRVWLNSGSMIVYPEKFIGKERNVYLSGEGYFKVTKDRKRPFLVQAGDVSVKVLGTSFNISGYAGDDEVTTTLESGAVEISVPGDGRVYSLTPDDQMTYTLSSDKVDIKKVDPEDFTSWTGETAAAGGSSTASITDGKARTIQTTTQLSYNKDFGKHTINAVAAFETQSYRYSSVTGSATDLTFPELKYDNLAQAKTLQTSSGYSMWTLVSYLARVNYSYAGKYMASVSVRRDGSSKFAKGNQFSTFPAAAVAWTINKENFMQNVPVISTLKLRASWGLTGSQAIEPYATKSAFGSINYPFSMGSSTSGIQISNPANPDLRWETTEQTNVGIDFGIFDDRLSRG